jgi:hypothetical protein
MTTKVARDPRRDAAAAPPLRGATVSKLKANDPFADPKGAVLTPRFVVAVLLMVLGIAWIVFYYAAVRSDPLAFPPAEAGSPKFMADLEDWNYLIGFGAFFLGLMISAHPSTPLGRGRGVVVGMLFCFILGLLWICTFYVISEDPSKFWVFNDLGQKNLFVGIAFMAVGFTFATRWE